MQSTHSLVKIHNTFDFFQLKNEPIKSRSMVEERLILKKKKKSKRAKKLGMERKKRKNGLIILVRGLTVSKARTNVANQMKLEMGRGVSMLTRKKRSKLKMIIMNRTEEATMLKTMPNR